MPLWTFLYSICLSAHLLLFGILSRSGIARYDSSMFSFLKNLKLFYTMVPHFTLPPAMYTFLISPHPQQHLLFSRFFCCRYWISFIDLNSFLYSLDINSLSVFSSAQFSHSVSLTLCNPMNHSTPGLPCPSPTHGVYSNSCPSSRWCHPAISSSVVPFSSCPQSLPASGSF